jgi:CrcB protein
MIMDKFLWVGLGGALGAILRYSISLLPLKSSFPFLTLITNVIGAFVIGIVVGLFEKHYLSSNINLFLKTGVCGGFTTFSTFSLETLTLLENGMPSIAMIYAFVSIIGCVIGVYLGKTIVGIRAL